MYTNYQLIFSATKVSGNRVYGKRFFARTPDKAQSLAKKLLLQMIGGEVLKHLVDVKIHQNEDPYHSWMMVLEGVPKECLPEELKPALMGGKLFFWAEESIPQFRGKGLEIYDGDDKFINIPKSWVLYKSEPREYFGGTIQVPGGYYYRNHRDIDIYYCGGNTFARVITTLVDIQGGPCRTEGSIEYFNK